MTGDEVLVSVAIVATGIIVWLCVAGPTLLTIRRMRQRRGRES